LARALLALLPGQPSVISLRGYLPGDILHPRREMVLWGRHRLSPDPGVGNR
jgi:hypothetical protein